MTEAERIASKLSQPMTDTLIRGMAGGGSARVYGHTNTIVALMDRNLITSSRDGHRWTRLGREVARALWPISVKTLDELHTLAIAENVMRNPITHSFRPGGRNGRCAVEGCDDVIESAVHAGHEPERMTLRVTASGREKIAAAQPERVTHLMSDDLLDACDTAESGAGLSVTPVPEHVTCAPCKALQPDRRVISRFGGRGYVVRDGDRTVTLSLGGAPLEISRRKFDEDWWPDTNPCGTVRITETVLALAYAGFEGGGVRGAVKAAFEAVGLQVTE